jgi:16S rRNA (guanine527-N7)-methyltransferase
VSPEAGFRDLLAPHAGGEVLDRLVRYAELLERWSARHSLVRFPNRAALVERHLVDALAGAVHLCGDGVLLDVGSGAGLPGVPLLAAAPAWRGVLVEPRQKRWAFLRLVIRELNLDASVERCRYQEVDRGSERFDAITVRALGGIEVLLEWASSRLSPAGAVLWWTTLGELEAVGDPHGWRVLSSPLPSLDRGRLVRFQPCFT